MMIKTKMRKGGRLCFDSKRPKAECPCSIYIPIYTHTFPFTFPLVHQPQHNPTKPCFLILSHKSHIHTHTHTHLTCSSHGRSADTTSTRRVPNPEPPQSTTFPRQNDPTTRWSSPPRHGSQRYDPSLQTHQCTKTRTLHMHHHLLPLDRHHSPRPLARLPPFKTPLHGDQCRHLRPQRNNPTLHLHHHAVHDFHKEPKQARLYLLR